MTKQYKRNQDESKSFEARVIANMFMADQCKVTAKEYEEVNEISNKDMLSLAKDIDFSFSRLNQERWTKANHFKKRLEHSRNKAQNSLTNGHYR